MRGTALLPSAALLLRSRLVCWVGHRSRKCRGGNMNNRAARRWNADGCRRKSADGNDGGRRGCSS